MQSISQSMGEKSQLLGIECNISIHVPELGRRHVHGIGLQIAEIRGRGSIAGRFYDRRPVQRVEKFTSS